MKAAVILAIAGIVAAQQCVTDCLANMAAQADALGCAADDQACLCTKDNYYYGVRDCSVQHCNDPNQASAAASVCPNFTPAAPVASATESGSGPEASSTPITTSEIVSTVTSDGSTFEVTSSTTVYGPGAGGASSAGSAVTLTAIATSSYTTVITSGSVVVTETGVTTISGINGVATSVSGSTFISASDSGSASGSATPSGAGSTTSAAGTTLTTSTSTGSASGETSEASSTASSSSSSAMGAQKTPAPIAGFLAAAGLAAALL